jgi:hypothetical protein
MPADYDFAIETKPAWCAVARAYGVGGAQRESVHIRAIERRHVDRRGDVARQHAAERRRQSNGLARQRRQIQVPRKARARLLGRDNFQKLLLPRGAANRRQEIGAIALGGLWFKTRSHGQGLITTSLCAGYPSLSALMRIHPFACASAASGT